MAGEFGRYIDAKRKGRGPNGTDILLKDIAEALGKTATYLSDIVKGRRNPPEKELLDRIADALHLNDEERAEMLDCAGRDRKEAAPDLPDYIMDEDIPYVRAALRRANAKGLGNDFWKKVFDDMDEED